MENQEQAQVASTEGVGGEAPAAQPELSIADLQNLKAVIDVAVKRGAFQAAEMSSIGGVYDRLNAFLVSVTPPPATAPQAPAA